MSRAYVHVLVVLASVTVSHNVMWCLGHSLGHLPLAKPSIRYHLINHILMVMIHHVGLII